jgi:RNA polymerase sigma factor (sigma-70 family)
MVRRTEAVAIREFRRLFQGGTLSGLTEAELLERFAADGDEAAFEVIVRRFGPMVLGVCRRMLGDRHAADDAFQATFLVLARRAGRIRDGSRLASWLFGVAHRVARRARAQDRRRKARERSDFVDLPGPPLGMAAEKAEVLRALDDEIARLPEAQRQPIVLCHLSGLTIDQAADRLGIPVGTARSRLARGRDRLRSRLEGRGFQGRSALLSPLLGAWTGRPSPSLPLLKQAVALAVGGSTSSKLAAVGVGSAPAFFLAQGALRTMTIWKLSTLAAGMVPVLAVGGSIGLASVYDPAGSLGLGLPAPAAAVAGLDDDKDEEKDRKGDDKEIKEERNEVIIEVRGSVDVPEIARVIGAEGLDEAESLKKIIATLEAELAHMRERLAAAEAEAGKPFVVEPDMVELEGRPRINVDVRPRMRIEEQSEALARRAEEMAARAAEAASRRAEEVAKVTELKAEELARVTELKAEELAVIARRQAEAAIALAEHQAEAAIAQAEQQAEGIAERAAEAVSRAIEAAQIEVKIGADNIARVEGEAKDEVEVETDVIIGGDNDKRERRIILRRQADAPRPPAPPVPPAPPEAPEAPAEPTAITIRPLAPSRPSAPAEAETVTILPTAPSRPAAAVGVRVLGGELNNRLDRIEERLDRLDSLEKKIDRLLETLGDRGEGV